ncbi:MAG: M48 family metallopeptidase [Polaribacter sp.]|nr:M48 family metallopeptidase [Polaribacter sp.]
MKKIIIQGTITVFLFFGSWYTIKQIDWVKIFRVEKVADKTAQKLGDFLWKTIKNTEEENKNSHVVKTIESIVTQICKSNKIERKNIKIHVINKDEINAFALPNGHLIVYSGLILNSDNQEELIGVICHEIAHIELHHVMKKLVKEIGLSALISMTTGGSGSEIIKETARMLSSSAFDRSLEKEADIKAVDYLISAKVNPDPFANFLYKLSDEEHAAAAYFKWISTHPDSRERAAYIIEYSKTKSTTYESMLSIETWEKVIEELREY